MAEKALLALGSMSRYIRDSNPTLSLNITLFLHDMLENYHSASPIKPSTQPCRVMTIINSIGNAADNTSIDIVKTHAFGADEFQQDIRTQLAAIRTLSRYSNTEVSAKK